MHSNWPYLKKYAASVKGIFHRMLNNMVLWKHFLGWNDGLFWGWGVGFISHSKGLLWCFRGMYCEMLECNVTTWCENLKHNHHLDNSCCKNERGDWSQQYEYNDRLQLFLQIIYASVCKSTWKTWWLWKLVAISATNYYCYTVLIVSWRSTSLTVGSIW